MSLQQTQTASFVYECYLGTHDLSTDTLMLALYSSEADLGPATTAYTSDGEITGSGYTAGGVELSGVTVVQATYGAYVDFDDVVVNATFTGCRGALIYNATRNNRAIAVLDFGADKQSSGTFTITMPASAADSALIRNSVREETS